MASVVSDNFSRPPDTYPVQLEALSALVWIIGSTHTALLNKVKSKLFRLINSPPLTDCLQSLKHRHNFASLWLCLSSAAVFMVTVLLNLLTAAPFFPHPRCARLSTLSYPYSIHLTNSRLNQLLSSFIPFNGKLWNSGWFCFFFPPSYDWNLLKEEYQDTCTTKLTFFSILFSLWARQC